MCKHLSLDRSRYHRKLVQKPIDVEMVKLKAVVRQIHSEMYATCGSRRMCAELNAQGFVVGLYEVPERLIENMWVTLFYRVSSISR